MTFLASIYSLGISLTVVFTVGRSTHIQNVFVFFANGHAYFVCCHK